MIADTNILILSRAKVMDAKTGRIRHIRGATTHERRQFIERVAREKNAGRRIEEPIVTVTLTDAEYERVREASAAMNQTPAEWAKTSMLGRFDKPQEAATPTRRPPKSHVKATIPADYDKPVSDGPVQYRDLELPEEPDVDVWGDKNL